MEALAFDDLVQALHHQLAALPDDWKGKNTQDAIKDAALGAFAVFFTQSPSFLAYQRTMQQAKGRSNGESLFGMEAMPCDNQIRTLLDPVAPAQLFPVFEGVYAALERTGHVSAFRSCQQPFCDLLLRHACNFILVCKPESHTTLHEWLAGVEAAGALEQFTLRHWNGRFHTLHTYRYANDVPLREGEDALWVNWCELTITQETDGTIRYRHAFATKHPVDRTSVEAVVQAGRARWKIENENNNTLKTKGYHLEHHDGHGKQYLSAVLLTLHLLAFLFHTLLGWVDQKYYLVRQALAVRQTFF